MDSTAYLTRSVEMAGTTSHPIPTLSKETVPFDRIITSGDDSDAVLDDGGDSFYGEEEYDWVEVVAMSCEDSSATENTGTRPQRKEKTQKNLIKEWRVNDDVQLAKSAEGNLFNATIESINPDGTVVIKFKDAELMMASKYNTESSALLSPVEETVENNKQSKDNDLDNVAKDAIADSSSGLPIQRALFNHIVSGTDSVINYEGHSLEDKRVTLDCDNGTDSVNALEERRQQVRVTGNDVLLVQSNELSYCPFCGGPQMDLTDHFTEEHTNSVHVKQWFKEKKKNAKRSLLKKMQNMGNYRHNCKVLRAGSGKLILSQPIPEGSNPSDFAPCPKCLGFFNRKGLLEHKCVGRLKNDANSRMTRILDSKLLLPLSQRMTNSVRAFVTGSAQEIEDIIAKDGLLCEFSHRDFVRFEFNEESSAQTKSKIVNLSKLLALMNEMNSGDGDMQRIIDSDSAHQLMTGLRALCSSSECEKENGDTFVTMISYLRECGVVLRGKALENSNWLLHDKSLKFVDLCDYWLLEMVDGGVNQKGWTHNETGNIVRTFTEDVVLVWRYLCEVCDQHKKLLEDTDTVTSSAELRQVVFTFSKAVLAKVLLFNKKEEDCIAKMRLEDFSGRHPPQESKVQEGTSLKWRRHLRNSLSRVTVKEETGKLKTILLTEEMIECIELLISKRYLAYISPCNKDIFTLALFSFKGEQITASESVKEFCSSCALVFQDMVTRPTLDKALGIVFQLTCLSNENPEVIASYKGDRGEEMPENVTLNQETFRICDLMKPFLDPEEFLSLLMDSSGHVPSSENMQEDKSQMVSDEGGVTTSKRKQRECETSCIDEEKENAGGISEEQGNETRNKKRKKKERDSSESQKVNKQQKTQICATRTRKPSVLPTSVIDGVFQWDKKYYCLFCGIPTAKIPRHLENNHSSLPQVMEWMAETDCSKKLGLLGKIRNMGNCKHNCQVLKEGVGRLIVVRRPSTATDPSQFIPCPDCYGFYSKGNLWHHTCQVALKIEGHDKVRSKLVHEGRLLLPVPPALSQSVLTWLAFMKRDEVVDCFVEDWLICEFAQKDLTGKSVNRSQFRITKTKLKMLASLLLKLQELSGNKKADLQEFMDPTRFPEVEDAVRALADYDTATATYGKPNVAEKMWQYLKMCSVVIRGTLLEVGQFARIESAWSFGKLCEGKILEIPEKYPQTRPEATDEHEEESKDQSDLALEGSISLDDWDDVGQELDMDGINRLLEGEEMDSLVSCDGQKRSMVQDVQAAGGNSGGDIPLVKRRRRKERGKRQFYTEEEKEAVWRHLGNAIKLNRTPGKMEIMKCKSQEPALQRRAWKNIKDFCKNTARARERAKLKEAVSRTVADTGLVVDLDPDQHEAEPDEMENSKEVNDSEDVEEREKEQIEVAGDNSDSEEVVERQEGMETDGGRGNKNDSEEDEEMGERRKTDGESKNISALERAGKDEHVLQSHKVITGDEEAEDSMEEESHNYGLRKSRRTKKISWRMEQFDGDDEDGDDSGKDAGVEELSDEDVREGEVDWVSEDEDTKWSTDEEYIPCHTSPTKGKNVKKSKSQKKRRMSERRSWSEEEKEAVNRHMEVFINKNILPSKEDVMKCKLQESVLDDRTWRNVKDFCRNAAIAKIRKERAKTEEKESSHREDNSLQKREMKVLKKQGPATPEELEAVRKHFKLILRCGLLPSRKVIEKMLWKETAFDGRSWGKIREFCIKERKRLQSQRAKGVLT